MPTASRNPDGHMGSRHLARERNLEPPPEDVLEHERGRQMLYFGFWAVP